MEEEKIDLIVFLNAGSIVESLAEKIKAVNRNIHFWQIDEYYISRLPKYADVNVLVFLDAEYNVGDHLSLIKETVKDLKNVWPVLLGDHPKEYFPLVFSMFPHHVIDMRKGTKMEIENLIISTADSKKVHWPLVPPLEEVNLTRFDPLINTLVDGNEEQRANLLHQIQSNKTLDRIGFSNRLRHEILNKYNPGRETDFASAIRDPKKMSSVRSWMLSALLWIDAESDESSDVLLNHLDIEFEPDENVRYWTLAGLYQIKASYLLVAVTYALKEEKYGPYRSLGIAINNSDSPETIQQFRADLRSEDFQTMWQVLRILRIVPIPELAIDVCEILNRVEDSSTVAYDAFYALANPGMANAAASTLSENPGTKNIVNRIIAVVRGSNPNTVRNFSGMLTVFNPSDVDAALTEARSDQEKRGIADQLRRFLNEYRTGKQSKDVYLAGYTSDTIDVTDDRLDIKEDVQTLTAIMLAKEVIPPIAIGLFGDWGTGKSFFMQSIRAEVKRLQKANHDNSASRYCKHIVQIDFNAWHYVDTNLWASLVSYIFEKLAAHVSPELNVEEKQQKLNTALDNAKTAVEKTEIGKQEVQELIKAKEAELAQLQLVRQEKEITFKDLEVKDIHDLLEPEQRKDLHKLLDDIGVPTALRNVEDLNNVVAEAYTVKGRITALFLAIFNSKDRKTLIFFLVLVLGVIPAIAWYVTTRLNITGFWPNVTAVITQITVVIVFIKNVIGKALKTINASIAQIEKTRKRIEEKLEEKRNKLTPQETVLEKQIAELRIKEAEAIKESSVSALKVTDLEKKIRDFQEAHSLSRFLADRNLSQDYRKHLGLISTIRQDFESLIDRLERARKDQGNKYPVDRIVLYIDDLDRCPTEKVMEVLQAVHLLLAYPLFVVVVGVDPRWLLHSLNTTFTAFGNKGKKSTPNGEQWNTTPQNFLEKIFQIPFSLRPMTDIGFEKLMDGLLLPASEEKLIEGVKDEQVKPVVLVTTSPLQSTAGEKEQTGNESNQKSEPDLVLIDNKLPKTTPTTPEEPASLINEESLIIKEWESRFAGELFSLIPTPRAAKRFSNIYRILKAAVRREEIEAFEGSTELPGSFQVPMLLLAILIYSPATAAQLFPALQKSTLQQTLTPNFKTLEEKLHPFMSRHSYPDDPELYAKWLPRVSRFSFELGRFGREFKK